MSSANLMSRTPSTTTPTWHQFERKVDEVKPSKTDINYLVMDYLITNGYPAAAHKFAVEANIQLRADEAIQERVEIRTAINSGNIQLAIEKINELNPEILDGDASLHFALLRLHLIELIRPCIPNPEERVGEVTAALEFAQTQLAPRATTNQQFLDDLECTLSLLLFPCEHIIPSLAALLDPTLRKDIATRVNEAILDAQNAQKEARLRNLVKLRVYAEAKARAVGKDIPDKLDIGLISDSQDVGNNNNSNGTNGRVSNVANDTVMSNSGDAEEHAVF
ncbi:hypothetical protein N7488_009343 [Penicillium malachiteum]|nr:hypothetical protein N7488_009343 [Penicillium malachiteum]